MNVLTVQWAAFHVCLLCCLLVTIRGLVGPFRCFRSPPRVPSDQHDFQNPHLPATLPLLFVFLSSYLGSHRTCHYFISHTLLLTIPECFGNSDTVDLRLRLTPDSTSAFVNFAGCISGGGDARSRTRTENRSSAVTHAYVHAKKKKCAKNEICFFFPWSAKMFEGHEGGTSRRRAPSNEGRFPEPPKKTKKGSMNRNKR